MVHLTFQQLFNCAGDVTLVLMQEESIYLVVQEPLHENIKHRHKSKNKETCRNETESIMTSQETKNIHQQTQGTQTAATINTKYSNTNVTEEKYHFMKHS